MAFLILLRSGRPKSIFHVVIGSLLASAGAVILGRGLWWFSIPHFQFPTSSPVELIFFALVGVLELGESLTFMMLNSERLERELLEAEANLKSTVQDLRQALAEVKKLSGFLPICASCKKIRDDKGYWQQIEQYISEHSEALFSHSTCPECARKLYPNLFIDASTPHKGDPK